jgi:hypothetical protein
MFHFEAAAKLSAGQEREKPPDPECRMNVSRIAIQTIRTAVVHNGVMRGKRRKDQSSRPNL